MRRKRPASTESEGAPRKIRCREQVPGECSAPRYVMTFATIRGMIPGSTFWAKKSLTHGIRQPRNYPVCSSHKTDISTHVRPAQPVSMLVSPRETSSVVTNNETEIRHCKNSKRLFGHPCNANRNEHAGKKSSASLFPTLSPMQLCQQQCDGPTTVVAFCVLGGRVTFLSSSRTESFAPWHTIFFLVHVAPFLKIAIMQGHDPTHGRCQAVIKISRVERGGVRRCL